uniref:molybdate ABC transporter substrate-binding protein n=1 Tax=Parerythrobacter lutipelagi TaxID=1964208 RepID=UPI0010F96D3B|nr:molybdate ABC transporter substrate-binding protein [Parerythrobacter lutipelagi]
MFRLSLILLAILGAVAACTPSEPKGPVVFAASSLQAPLEDLAAQWEASGRPAPVLSFAASATLARQIENGAPSDIYISADRQWIDFLLDESGNDESVLRLIARNRLVLARHADGKEWSRESVFGSLDSLAIATGDPQTVPLGRFAQEALVSENLWDAAEPNIVGAQSARAAAVLVSRGEAPLGVLYASDADNTDAVEVVAIFPSASHSPIEYFATRLPASAHPDADSFLEFLASAEAANVFARHGFVRP